MTERDREATRTRRSFLAATAATVGAASLAGCTSSAVSYDVEIADRPDFVNDIEMMYTSSTERDGLKPSIRLLFPINTSEYDQLPSYAIVTQPSDDTHTFERREDYPSSLIEEERGMWIDAETGDWRLELYNQNDEKIRSGTFRVVRLDHCRNSLDEKTVECPNND